MPQHRRAHALKHSCVLSVQGLKRNRSAHMKEVARTSLPVIFSVAVANQTRNQHTEICRHSSNPPSERFHINAERVIVG